MTNPEWPREGGCITAQSLVVCIAIATTYDDQTVLGNYRMRLCFCPSCGDQFVVDDLTYAMALLADAAWLRSEYVEDTRIPYDQRALYAESAAEWERRANILAPDPRQLGFGVGER